ncbi:MAG: protein kinase [Planctomycetes bacterium]|nr:protein kinase [Planctomycetota bacterium]
MGLNGTLGRYVIRGVLGRGGMGVVYRALDPELGREVALKVLSGGALASESHRERFRREARTAARLAHPRVVRVHDVGTHQGAPYFTMDLVEGEPLTRIPEGGCPDLRASFALLARVAEAVHYLHSQGVVHRDLKPGNILVDLAGEPHVTDFGLALDREADGRLTRSGAVLGTPSYMAPEQCGGGGDVDARTDVWALGAVAYAMATGRPPFVGEGITAVVTAILDEEPPAPRALRGDLPAAAQAVILKALEKEPARRYPDALAMALELDRLGRGEVGLARAPGALVRLARRARRRGGRHPALALAAAAALLAGGLAVRAHLRALEAGRLALEARDHLRAGQPTEALREAALALERVAGHRGALRVRAEALAVEGRLAEALEDHDGLVRDDPDGEDHLARSAVLQALGREAEAEADRAEARRRAGAGFDTATERARGRLKEACALDDMEAARREATAVLVREPLDAEARRIHAIACLATGRASEALGDAERLLAGEPGAGAPRLHRLRAVCLYRLGRPSEALESFDRAWSLDPEGMANDDAFFHHFNNAVGQAWGADPEAPRRRAVRYRWAASANRSNAMHNRTWSLFGLAEALRDLGRPGEALAALDEAEAGDPDYRLYLDRHRAQHFEAVGDTGAALAAWRRLAEWTAAFPEGTLEAGERREALRRLEEAGR